MNRNLQAVLDEIFAPYARSDAPGAIVGVAHRGRTIVRTAFGLANVEHGVANSASTRFPIASVTKHFTCAAVLRLAQAGRLDLDAPVGRWLPELQPQQQGVTPRQLMSHTAGLRCYLDVTMPINGWAVRPTGLPLQVQARQSAFNFEPGHGMSYCNGGYLLLALMIERIGGRPFERHLHEQFFAPLRMDATAVQRRQVPVPRGVADSYLPCEGGWQRGAPFSEDFTGDGAMVSSVDDLLRWAAWLRGAEGAPLLAAMGTRTLLANGHEVDYGLGLIHEVWRGQRILQHGGSLRGAQCQFMMLPDHELDVAVLCNRIADTRGLALRLVQAVLGEAALAPAVPAPASADYAPLLGHWLEPETGALYTFAEVEGRLALGAFGLPPAPLEGAGDVAPGVLPFIHRLIGRSTHFRFDASAGDAALDVIETGFARRARRITGKPLPAAQIAAQAAGPFFNADAGGSLRLAAQDGQLVLLGHGEYGAAGWRAEALAPDLVRAWGEGLPVGYLLRLERDGEGRVGALRLSSLRTRSLRFAAR
jgi:CubicO group peptidase (beta-lactamase class C family)